MGTGPPSSKISTSTVYAHHLPFLLIKPCVTQHAVIIILEYIKIFYPKLFKSVQQCHSNVTCNLVAMVTVGHVVLAHAVMSPQK